VRRRRRSALVGCLCSKIRTSLPLLVSVHTVERHLEGYQISGIACTLGPALPGQVPRIQHVKDLVAGASVVFADRGEEPQRSAPALRSVLQATHRPACCRSA
jgi:hypothetical protein